MLANYDSNSNIDDLTDIEIYAAIRYLEADPTKVDERPADDQDKHNAVICVCIALLSLAFLWLHLR